MRVTRQRRGFVRHVKPRRTLIAIALALFASSDVQAQAFLAAPSFFPAAPGVLAGRLDETGAPVWDGSFARVSSGFQVSSSKHFGTSAGPTYGLEGGRTWREGEVVFGLVGGLEGFSPIGGYGSPGFGRATYTRDVAGGFRLQAGVLAADDVLVYSKLGVALVHEALRFGPSPVSLGFTRENIALRPDARVGAEWAITDNVTVGLELGVTGQAVR